MEKKENNRPAAHFKVRGVRASLWKELRKGPSGQAFDAWTVSLDRSYKDASGEWKHTASLKETDIPRAILALTLAYQHICKQGGDGEDAT